MFVAAEVPRFLFPESPGGTACSGRGTRLEACEHVAPTELARGPVWVLPLLQTCRPAGAKKEVFDLLTVGYFSYITKSNKYLEV